MTPVAIRLPDEVVRALDELVDKGRYSTRTDAIRSAIAALLATYQEAAIDRVLVEAYTRQPQTDEELAVARAATRVLIEEEPW
jgi:Arc/MetJ-type ribon-helix-helix transcriptional regulator